ncbi:hypothetical protein IJG21_03090, partial [Candidatus Saccharibacteria bacterium]|nr:hypothetical protein [Candidatus Saccharibacteria bacterium]
MSRKLLPLIFAILCFIILVVSGVKIVLWKIDSEKTNSEITELLEKTSVSEVEDDSADVIPSDEDSSED